MGDVTTGLPLRHRPGAIRGQDQGSEKLSDDLNTGTVFVSSELVASNKMAVAEWVWKQAADPKQQQTVYTRPLKDKLDKLQIAHEIVWEPGPGEDTRARVEAVNRWFVHDWQTLDNKIKSSIVEGVSVFLAMFDMPDVAKVFCPAAPLTSDDPQAIILQAAIKRARGGQGREGARRSRSRKRSQNQRRNRSRRPTSRRPASRRQRQASSTHGEANRRRRRRRPASRTRSQRPRRTATRRTPHRGNWCNPSLRLTATKPPQPLPRLPNRQPRSRSTYRRSLS